MVTRKFSYRRKQKKTISIFLDWPFPSPLFSEDKSVNAFHVQLKGKLDLNEFYNLMFLHISNQKITHLEIGSCSKIQHLRIEKCSNLVEISGLEKLTEVRNFFCNLAFNPLLFSNRKKWKGASGAMNFEEKEWISVADEALVNLRRYVEWEIRYSEIFEQIKVETELSKLTDGGYYSQVMSDLPSDEEKNRVKNIIDNFHSSRNFPLSNIEKYPNISLLIRAVYCLISTNIKLLHKLDPLTNRDLLSFLKYKSTSGKEFCENGERMFSDEEWKIERPKLENELKKQQILFQEVRENLVEDIANLRQELIQYSFHNQSLEDQLSQKIKELEVTKKKNELLSEELEKHIGDQELVNQVLQEVNQQITYLNIK